MTDKLSPQVQIPKLSKKIMEEEQRQLAAIKPQTVLAAEDTGSSAHKMVDENAHVTDKIYLFPESYNALRRELHEHWPTLWIAVSWPMAHQAEDFVAIMNEALDLKIQFDGNKVDATCKTFLDALRTKRGVSSLH